MWTRATLKENGKIAFKRNWLTCVLVCVVTSFLGGEAFGGTVNFNRNARTSQSQMGNLSGLTTADLQNMLMQSMVYLSIMLIALIIALVIQTVLGNIVTVGNHRYFMENREHRTDVNKLFWAFSGGRYKNVLITMFLRGLKIALWSLLFVIPGIVKSYEYMMVPYILAENPHIDQQRAFELSREMMNGHKMEAFVLQLSFIGWEILGALTWGILTVAYVSPYMSATHAEFYTAIKTEALHKGFTTRTELPGFDDSVIDADVIV